MRCGTPEMGRNFGSSTLFTAKRMSIWALNLPQASTFPFQQAYKTQPKKAKNASHSSKEGTVFFTRFLLVFSILVRFLGKKIINRYVLSSLND
jgi:hypothetical protein